MKTERLHPLLAIIFILMLTIAPFLLCFGAIALPEIIFKFKLDIYPGTVQVGEAYGYYGADTGERVVYYWTSDPIDVVKSHFAAFAPPFAMHPHFQHLMTSFNPHSPSTTPISNEVDACGYKRLLTCVTVEVVPVDKPLNRLPLIVAPPSWTNVTQVTPLDNYLSRGTLIIYHYFVNDF